MKQLLNKFLLVILLITAFLPGMVNADGVEEGVNFSASATLPSNQIDSNKSYFDLRMEPGQEQTVYVTLYNNANTSINVKTLLNTASTSNTGLIDYSRPGIRDSSMKIAISDIAKIDSDIITIPKWSSVKIPITIKMPDTEFEGILLGGIVATKLNTEESTDHSDGIMIKNEYSYVIGLRLSLKDTKVIPDLHLKYIKPKLVNSRTAMVANIQNDRPIDAQNLLFKAQVYQKKSGKKVLVRTVEKKNFSMAPNSNFDFTMDWQNKIIEPGTYILHMTADNEGGHWEWDEEFVITEKEANDINNHAVIIVNEFPNIWLIIIIVVLLFIIVIFFIMKRRCRKRWTRSNKGTCRGKRCDSCDNEKTSL